MTDLVPAGPPAGERHRVRMHDRIIVDPRAFGLSAFRALPDGRGRQYTTSWTPGDPWRGCERMVRMARTVGFITAGPDRDAYAVLDIVAENGDVIQTFPVPHARAFRWFYRKLHLRVESEN